MYPRPPRAPFVHVLPLLWSRHRSVTLLCAPVLCLSIDQSDCRHPAVSCRPHHGLPVIKYVPCLHACILLILVQVPGL